MDSVILREFLRAARLVELMQSRPIMLWNEKEK